MSMSSRAGVKPAYAALVAVCGAAMLAASCAVAPIKSEEAELSPGESYIGRVRLERFLDEPDGYCLDVPGPEGGEMLQFPLVAHTCHADPLSDQVFRINVDGGQLIRWTNDKHDLCFTADAAEPMSALNLRECGQPDLQSFNYTSRGEFQLASTDLCIHVERTGPAMRNPVEEGQDAYGRGRSVNPQFTHLMRRLEMRPCGDGDPAMSRWRAIE